MSGRRPEREYRDKYSDDRLSLAQEIAETLEANGHWVPYDWAGPDLIVAVGLALKKKES